MGFKDFLKNFSSKPAAAPIEKTRLAFKDVDAWITKEETKSKEAENETFQGIEEALQTFMSELERATDALQEVDVTTGIADKRIQSIVKGNRQKYLGHIRALRRRIQNLEEKDLQGFATRMNDILMEFYEKSKENYEKTTILVGKEMAVTHKTITDFSQGLKQTVDESQELIAQLGRIAAVQETLSLLRESDEVIEDTTKDMEEIEKRIADADKRIHGIEEQIEKVKSSEQYAKNVQEVKKQQEALAFVKRELQALRKMIDFKGLTSVFHGSTRMMERLKAHRTNFAEAIRKDGGKQMLALLEEANMCTPEIREKIKHLNELKKLSRITWHDETKDLETEQNAIRAAQEESRLEKDTEERKLERLRADQDNLKKDLRQELAALDVLLDG